MFHMVDTVNYKFFRNHSVCCSVLRDLVEAKGLSQHYCREIMIISIFIEY